MIVWPFILALAALLATAYAILIRWLNDHPRYGAFWSAHSWFEVVVGDLLIAVTVWALAGLELFLLVLAVMTIWGAPMIIGTLISYAREEARRVEQEQAREITDC